VTGYSGTPLPRKLGIGEGDRVSIIEGPSPLPEGLRELPAGVSVRTSARGGADVAVCFVTRRAVLERRFGALKRAIAYDGRLWFAWPKRSSGVDTDITEDVVREVALANGLVDNKVCAIDETWSGLQLVYRLADRPR
jgi:hypothetical protein